MSPDDAVAGTRLVTTEGRGHGGGVTFSVRDASGKETSVKPLRP